MLARPEPSGAGGLAAHEKHSGIGPVVGIVIILLLVIFGGLYFWGASMNKKTEPLPFIPGDNPTQENQ